MQSADNTWLTYTSFLKSRPFKTTKAVIMELSRQRRLIHSLTNGGSCGHHHHYQHQHTARCLRRNGRPPQPDRAVCSVPFSTFQNHHCHSECESNHRNPRLVIVLNVVPHFNQYSTDMQFGRIILRTASSITIVVTRSKVVLHFVHTYVWCAFLLSCTVFPLHVALTRICYQG